MNLIQSVSFVSSTTESLRIPSHVLEAAHYFKEYCYEEIHFIIICHHWTLKIGISWRFTEHFAAVFSACRVSTQLPGVAADKEVDSPDEVCMASEESTPPECGVM